MKSAKEILLETVGKDCYWEEMDNLTNAPVEAVVKAMELYLLQELEGIVEDCEVTYPEYLIEAAKGKIRDIEATLK